MRPGPRSRAWLLPLMVLVVALGLGSRSAAARVHLPHLVTDYAGDTLWTVMVYLCLVFALPRPDATVLVGLTDVPVLDPVGTEDPQVTDEEERGLLRSLSSALELPLEREDVIGRFAGLRPLVDRGDGETADLSRRHALIEDPDSHVLTIVGGKLTTYRRMAQDAVDAIAARPGVGAGPCRTTRLPLVGATPKIVEDLRTEMRAQGLL